MGFLDDLKRQAEAAKAERNTDNAAAERNALLTEAACKTVFGYFDTLIRQLDVLEPVSKTRYALDRRTVFEQLPMVELKVDARRRKLRGTDAYDYIALHGRLRDGRKIAFAKDFVAEIEKIDAKLRQAGAPVHAQALRNPDNNKLQEMRYEVLVDFSFGVTVTPDHDHARLHFKVMNFDGFETITLDLPALEVGSARLDELAKWMLGEPHRFFDGARNLRRVEA
ncbi:hypothetical protein [Piscinibacter sp.]|uniref:hypothetical protein n=1 Tax=Piscinibacter sp. TaxID=1903157 RepID=UPI0039E54003